MDEEAYILLLLSDANLPTGSFVASAGFESWVAHGFLSSGGGTSQDKLQSVVNFVRDNIQSYAQSSLAFVSDAHQAVEAMVRALRSPDKARSESSPTVDDTVAILSALDELFETMTLNVVSRRASRAQGVALLSLYSKGFTKPRLDRGASNAPLVAQTPVPGVPPDVPDIDTAVGQLVDKLKFSVRREDTPGHLPICWGVLTASLGLTLERAQFLHLFLCARGMLSAGVRMNVIGPYAAQQLLLHMIRPIIDVETERCCHLRTGVRLRRANGDTSGILQDVQEQNGPATTWPLGEILAARHDLQHSRIFNS